MQGGLSHLANATFDSDIHSFSSHPTQPWIAAIFRERVPRGIRLSRIILLDSACTVHIVTESWLLNDFVTIPPEKIKCGNSQHVMYATGRGTLVTRNMPPDGSTRVTRFGGCIYVPGFGTNLLSVKKLSTTATGSGVLFRAGAQFMGAQNNLMGYSPEPVHRSDLHPLVCTIISGDAVPPQCV